MIHTSYLVFLLNLLFYTQNYEFQYIFTGVFLIFIFMQFWKINQ